MALSVDSDTKLSQVVPIPPEHNGVQGTAVDLLMTETRDTIYSYFEYDSAGDLLLKVGEFDWHVPLTKWNDALVINNLGNANFPF